LCGRRGCIGRPHGGRRLRLPFVPMAVKFAVVQSHPAPTHISRNMVHEERRSPSRPLPDNGDEGSAAG
jgi:hypothetical protein